MDQVYRGVAVELTDVQNGGKFARCSFSGCSLGMQIRRPSERIVLRGFSAIDCTVDSVNVGPVVFEDCLVEDLTTVDHLWILGAAFKRCTIRGQVGRVIFFEEFVPTEPRDSPTNAPFVGENTRIYESVEWALDISEAEFTDVDLRSIPAELVRTNRVNQVKVNYDAACSALQAGVFDLHPSKGFVEICLEDYEMSHFNFVLATHPKDPSYRERIELFDLLGQHNIILS